MYKYLPHIFVYNLFFWMIVKFGLFRSSGGGGGDSHFKCGESVSFAAPLRCGRVRLGLRGSRGGQRGPNPLQKFKFPLINIIKLQKLCLGPTPSKTQITVGPPHPLEKFSESAHHLDWPKLAVEMFLMLQNN